MHLVFVSVHGHRELEVVRNGSGADGDALPVVNAQVMSDVQRGGQGGGGCESQQTAHAQTIPQHLHTYQVIIERKLNRTPTMQRACKLMLRCLTADHHHHVSSEWISLTLVFKVIWSGGVVYSTSTSGCPNSFNVHTDCRRYIPSEHASPYTV